MTPPERQTSEVPRLSQLRALREIGLDRVQRAAFLRREMVVYSFPTTTEPAIAVIQWLGRRLRSGIISIHDVGGGVRDLARFRDRSQVVAGLIGAMELELFGAAIINARLEAILLRQGFARAAETVPEVLGGGTMDILAKVFPIT